MQPLLWERVFAIWLDFLVSSFPEMIIDFDGHLEVNVKNYFNMVS